MGRLLILFILVIAAVTSANAQNLEFIDFKVRDNQNVWTYSVTAKSKESLQVCLEAPRSAYVKRVLQTTEDSKEERAVTSTKKDSLRKKKVVISTTEDSLKKTSATSTTEDTEQTSVTSTTEDTEQTKRVIPKMEYSLRQGRSTLGTLELTFKSAEKSDSEQKFTFEVIAPKNVTKNGEIVWTINSGSKKKGTLPGPIDVGDPIIRYVLAAGYSLKDNFDVDFKVEDKAVLIKNESRMRHSFSAGLVLSCLNWNNKVALDLLLSAEFGVDSSRVIDGFIGGITVRAPQFRKFRLPEVFVGVSFRTEQNLKSGFKQVAQELANDINAVTIKELSKLNTKDNKINPEAIKRNFARFNGLEPCDYDGFPTFDPRDKEPIFYGTPLIDRTNCALIFGFIVPLDIGNRVSSWIGTRLGI